ncbi:hypothetical protein AG1IA_09937 [Rhizoctonia solani AG-1 IA]|uniref:Uncharacterized protein n=1 Tax=Thanatephorus cucumeris (strain AG1-IA) TaxID=983506 RepID=L8WCX1_THACA|nr:hypothetical protein AG1IA_09937 [Rhizoctonia solani AG-1 IA]
MLPEQRVTATVDSKKPDCRLVRTKFGYGGSERSRWMMLRVHTRSWFVIPSTQRPKPVQ